MESLAYIHLALAYEACAEESNISGQEDLKQLPTLNWQQLSSQTWLYLLPVAIMLSLLGIATQALAELQPGAKGAEVVSLQERLQQLGYYQGRITGNFGPYTTDVVTQFQKDQGLTADGIVGDQTAAALSQKRQNRSTRSNKARSQSTVSTSAVRTAKNSTQSGDRSSRTQQAQPSATSNSTNSFVGLGDRGSAVSSIQQRLKQAGYYTGAIDGVFTSATESALKEFQAAKRLVADGIVGSKTLAALQGVSRKAQTPSSKPVADGSILQSGSRGEAVASLQRRLKQLGYYSSPITNEFNPQTKEAVIQFQQDQNLTADGIAGPNTLSALANNINRNSVQALQKRLQANGFYQGPINGILNQQTQAAIASAQAAYGISADDIKKGNF